MRIPKTDQVYLVCSVPPASKATDQAAVRILIGRYSRSRRKVRLQAVQKYRSRIGVYSFIGRSLNRSTGHAMRTLPEIEVGEATAHQSETVETIARPGSRAESQAIFHQCDCAGSSSAPKKPLQREPASATFPNGLRDVHAMNDAADALSAMQNGSSCCGPTDNKLRKRELRDD
jgi:hypothetical protein